MPASFPSNLVARVGFDYRSGGSGTFFDYWETVSRTYSATHGFTAANPYINGTYDTFSGGSNWTTRPNSPDLWGKQLEAGFFQMVFPGFGTNDFCIEWDYNKQYSSTSHPIVKLMLPNDANGRQNWIELVALGGSPSGIKLVHITVLSATYNPSTTLWTYEFRGVALDGTTNNTYLMLLPIRNQSLIRTTSRWKMYYRNGVFGIQANTSSSTSGSNYQEIFNTSNFSGWPTIDVQKIIFGGESFDYLSNNFNGGTYNTTQNTTNTGYWDEIWVKNNPTAQDVALLTAQGEPIKDIWLGSMSNSSTFDQNTVGGFAVFGESAISTDTGIAAQSRNIIADEPDAFVISSQDSFTARNLVGFPEELETLIYVEDDYFEYTVYVAEGYFSADYIYPDGYYIETQVGIDLGGLMTQDLPGDNAIVATAGLQLFSGTAVSSDFGITEISTRIRPGNVAVDSSFGSTVAARNIIDIPYSFETGFDQVFSGGRIRPLQAAFDAEWQETIGSNIFVEQGGSGIIGASSGLTGEGGYLQVLGNNTFAADSSLNIQFAGGTSAGLILGGFEWQGVLDTESNILAGLSLPLQSVLLGEFELETTPGYLMNNWQLEPVETDVGIAALPSVVFVQQAFLASRFSTGPSILAGFGLFADTHLQADNITLSAGRLWIVDPYRTIRVKPENRVFATLPESRLFSVSSEIRKIATVEETRIIEVKPETRVYTIPLTAATRKNNTRLERV